MSASAGTSKDCASNAARLVIRAPNHLGDVVMALPALRQESAADVLVIRWLAPLVELALAGAEGPTRRVIALDRGRRGFHHAVHTLRRARYERGVLIPPSLSSALLFFLGKVGERRGTATNGRTLLLTEPVPRGAMEGMHRASAYQMLVSGTPYTSKPELRLSIPAALHEGWRRLVPDDGRRRIGIFPGSNASARRWDAERFAAVAERLSRDGFQVLVFGASHEKLLTAQVAGSSGVDLGGRTDLLTLAAGLQDVELLVTNDSGPMHLAAAVGTRTVSLLGAADPIATEPLGDGHSILRRSDLPCVPCLATVCPRRGRGTILPQGERECLRLIAVDDVLRETRVRLG
jgi:heptosyltransferase II